MAVVEFVIVPLGIGTTSVSRYVAAIEQELSEHSEGLNYELTAMSTIIEGDLDQILAVIRRLHEVPYRLDAKRVSTTIRIDDRRDKVGTIKQKVESVREKLK